MKTRILLRVSVVGGVLILTSLACAAQTSWPAPYENLKVLNNFVTELSDTTFEQGGAHDWTFANPREGWVFFSLAGAAGNAPRAQISKRPRLLIWRGNPETGALECMQFLSEGEHTLHIECGAQAHLVIRAIPELEFCYYPSGAHIAAFGPYDKPYVERYVLPHVNTLITHADAPPAEFDAWVREGRHWVGNAALPGLGKPEAPSVDEVYAAWADNPGVAAPGFAGVIVDEFLDDSPAHYQAWGAAVDRLTALDTFKNRRFYAWCNDIYTNDAAKAFCESLLQQNHRLVFERYLPEGTTLEEAEQYIDERVAKTVAGFKQALPGVERNMVMCLGYLSAPPESLNRDPLVDYRVFMDIQFHHLANDPLYWGLYGLMEYMAAYADEEAVRWAHQLFRHYAIEGNRDRLTSDPYILPHIKNPDFAQDLEGWIVEPVERGAIATRTQEGFSWLQGRYPETRQGDSFCVMKRSYKGPNVIRQTLTQLTPGRLYSVKAIATQLDDMHSKQPAPIGIRVDGAERLGKYSFMAVFPSCYSHESGEFTRDHPAYFTLHRVVFRPEKDTAELILSDWLKAQEPGGALDKETGFNFIEVQPFLEP